MEASFSKIPAPAWLVMSYALLGGLLYWSGIQEPAQLSASVFFVCLLSSWIPAYVYANRKDMAHNKVFWISQSAAMVVALIVLCVIAPWVLHMNDEIVEEGRAQLGWGGIGSGIVAYLLVQDLCTSIVRRAFHITETSVEKLVTKHDEKG
jgi:hypothetical protein